MGIMDMFQEAGSSLLNAITPTKKPGEFCLNECNINDIRCEACLAEQDKIRAAVNEWQNLEIAFENAANDPQAAEKKRITKCSLCGAPIEKSEQSCPYCGEPYPAGAVAVDIPTSKTEQDNMLLQKASEIYDIYAAIKKRVYANKGSDMKSKLPGFIGGAATVVYATANKFVDMTPQDIRRIANQNGVSYCDYVVGVMQGVYKCAGEIKIQQMNESIAEMQQQSAERQKESNERSEKRRREFEEMRQQRQEEYARHRQIEDERQARLKEIEQNKRKLQERMVAIRSYNPDCCGNCAYYMTNDSKCGRDGYKRVSASDSCGWHKYK